MRVERHEQRRDQRAAILDRAQQRNDFLRDLLDTRCEETLLDPLSASHRTRYAYFSRSR